jgi:NADH-quinone oxidoreductase subunit C
MRQSSSVPEEAVILPAAANGFNGAVSGTKPAAYNSAVSTPTQIAARISSRFAVDGVSAEDKHPRVQLSVGRWDPLARFLRHDPVLKLDWLACLTGIDCPADGQVAVVYDLYSFDHRHRFAVRVTAPRESPVFPSMTELWPAADWHEREAFDLLGFEFTGRQNLRRILLADDWEGHPLRKDYVFPQSYHGIPTTLEKT